MVIKVIQKREVARQGKINYQSVASAYREQIIIIIIIIIIISLITILILYIILDIFKIVIIIGEALKGTFFISIITLTI